MLRASFGLTTKLLVAFAALMVGGCATLPSEVVRPQSVAIPATAETALGGIAALVQPGPAQSGFRLLYTGTQALHARLELAGRAGRSIDIQSHYVRDDDSGRLLLRALRDAANRGVRVRLLLDDLLTAGTDELLLGLAAHDNVELRLFNPFPASRGSLAGRFAASLADVGRLHRRMHNKMVIADGAMAVVGGRNIADHYFLQDNTTNFFDLDVLVLGSVLPGLQGLFDVYWNSRHSYPVESISRSELTPGERRRGLRRCHWRPRSASTADTARLRPARSAAARRRPRSARADVALGHGRSLRRFAGRRSQANRSCSGRHSPKAPMAR